jgi:hypothetical protein
MHTELAKNCSRNSCFYLGIPWIVYKLRDVFNNSKVAFLASGASKLIHEFVARYSNQPCRGDLVNHPRLCTRYSSKKRFRSQFFGNRLRSTPTSKIPVHLRQSNVVERE